MSIRVEHLQKSFGTFQALKDVSLDFPTGELVALLGPSGCGKTTLLRIIAGLETADSGRVWLDGDDASDTHVRERQVGFVFQHYALFKHMRVMDNIAFGLRARRKNKPKESEIKRRVLELLDLVQLSGLERRFPAQLSGGQRQRVALARAIVVNSGNANAFTGKRGVAAVEGTVDAVVDVLGCRKNEVYLASTGVIGEPLNDKRITDNLGALIKDLHDDAWNDAARAIMTTDTFEKVATRSAKIGDVEVTINGIAKGSGMIAPDMATMLAFVATDAKIPAAILQTLLSKAADRSFNCITVDGDTSTNDSFILMATGQAGNETLSDGLSADYAAFRAAVLELSIWLAQAIVRDGEGATKFITLQIEGGRSRDECRKVGYAIGHSPLVKTAFFASDPNLGRILAAIGYAGIDDLDVSGIRVWLGSSTEEVLVAEKGGRAASYREEAGARVMKEAEITVRVDLARGDQASTLWSCDFSYDYVKINADYRS
mgnify:CR=1 FL=1